MQRAIPCTVMRGGTSKGLYFLASELPDDERERDRLLLRAMGSPDARQIDGMGGAHPLTSKVAIISPGTTPDVDVDYLFLQLGVDEAHVSAGQNCGNILAGVGPFAIEQGLVEAVDGVTQVTIHMVNTGARAIASIQTPGKQVNYSGSTRIDGVPGTAAALPIEFLDIAGSSCGALLPTGEPRNRINDLNVTCIDNGMPVVIVVASDLDISGCESPEQLEQNTELKQRVEALRLAAGQLMGLGDVSEKTVPKMCLVSAPQAGGDINTRTFIPHRVHEAIGVLGSVSVATACAIPGSVTQDLCQLEANRQSHSIEVEHPTGFFNVNISTSGDDQTSTHRASLMRTARLLMRGELMVPLAEAGDEY